MLLGGWQWPMTNFEIETSFGEPSNESVSPGVELLSDSDEVLSAEEGELVFAARAPQSRGDIPYALGSFVVLEHEGDFRSLYAHLDRQVELDDSSVGEGATLGGVGRTGLRGGNTLGFRIIDVQRHAYVNPLSILPKLEDESAPQIEEVELSRGDRRIWSSSADEAESEAVTEGRAQLSARIYDGDGGGVYRGEGTPHSVSVLMNGEQEFSVTLETLVLADGEMRFSKRGTGAGMYGADERMQLGSYDVTPGTNLLEIIAVDHAGNEQVMSYEILGETE